MRKSVNQQKEKSPCTWLGGWREEKRQYKPSAHTNKLSVPIITGFSLSHSYWKQAAHKDTMQVNV